MSKFFSLIVFISFGLGLRSQTTALNWTKNDCNHGSQHILFDELDSGFVIVNDYVMLGSCVQCGYATQELEAIVSQYNALYPGKVLLYSTGFDSSYTCSDMANWASAFGLVNNTLFIDGTLEFNYYGGFGMPLVVVLGGGTSHTVFTQINGYSQSDSTILKNAIEDAIAVSGIKKSSGENQISVFPSPANEVINIELPGKTSGPVEISLMDAFGKKIRSVNATKGNSIFQMNVGDLAPGIYFIRVYSGNGNEAIRKLIISR